MRRLWSYQSAAPIRAIRVAREPGTILCWDESDTLTWLSFAGAAVASWRSPVPLAGIDCADDGSCAVALGKQGHIWSLNSNLQLRWERDVVEKGSAIAVAPFGGRLAVADGNGGVMFLDGGGREVVRFSNPRPLVYLAFVSERPMLVGSADYGYLASFNLSGQRRWHESPVAHCGGLAVTGLLIALACFSDGVSFYDLGGRRFPGGSHFGPCRLIALTYDGSLVLTADLDGHVHLHDRAGKLRGEHRPASAVASVALDALGRMAFLGHMDGTITALETR